MSIKEKLSRLHDSRKRAEERSEHDQATGAYTAEDAVEYREPPGERDDGVRIESHTHDTADSHGGIDLAAYRELTPADLPDDALEATEPVAPEEILFVDTETTGLSEEAYAFCIGLGRWRGSEFVVRHLVLETPDAEARLLRKAGSYAESADAICSYNGRQFDLPLLERRASERDVPVPFGGGGDERPHIDLLEIARDRLPELESHKLSDLERNLLGFERTDDLGGADVPDAWSSYLETGAFDRLEPVLRHNRLDIVSLCAALVGFAADSATAASGAERASTSRESREPDRRGPRGDDEGDRSEHTRRERGGVAEQLSRSYSLRNRSGARGERNVSRETQPDAERSSDVSRSESAGGAGDGSSTEADSPQGRTESLRKRAERHLASASWEEARPLLHEIVAIHPRHPYALEKLVELYEETGETAMAAHFRSRLRDVSPY